MDRRSSLFPILSGVILVALLAVSGFVVLTKFNPCLFASQDSIACDPHIYPGSVMVVNQMHRLDKEEAADQTMVETFTYDQDAGSWLHFLGTHEKVFIVYGRVIAGFDLTKLSKDDVAVSQTTGSITLNLPAPEILHSEIDLKTTHIYDQSTGVDFLWNEDMDKNQQDQLLANTRIKMTQDACQENLLQAASDNGKQHFTALLQSMGFKQVTVNVASGGGCNVPAV